MGSTTLDMSSAVRSLEEMLQGWLLSGWSDWGVSPFAVRGVNTGLYLYNLRITSGSSRRSI